MVYLKVNSCVQDVQRCAHSSYRGRVDDEIEVRIVKFSKEMDVEEDGEIDLLRTLYLRCLYLPNRCFETVNTPQM
jgi:hypothetical protein